MDSLSHVDDTIEAGQSIENAPHQSPITSLQHARKFLLAGAVLLGLAGADAEAQSKGAAIKSKGKAIPAARAKSEQELAQEKKAAPVVVPVKDVPAFKGAGILNAGESGEMVEALKAAGYLTLENQPKTPQEAVIRGPSIVRPSGYRLTPIEISTDVRFHKRAQVVLPCPRDIMDQRHAGCQVVVMQNGNQVPCESSIIYSEKSEAGFINPYVSIKFQTQGAGTVIVRHWLVTGEYDPMSDESMKVKLSPTSTAHILAAFDAANNLPYDPSSGGFDVANALRNKRGDCGQKAVIARHAFAQNAAQCPGVGVDVLEGYSYRVPNVDAPYGGNHALNVVSSEGGLMTFDGRGAGGKYIGPQTGFVATGIGGEETIRGLPLAISRWKKGTNLGLYFNISPGRAHMSAPGFGKNGAALSQAQPSPEVTKYATWLRTQNEKKYQ